MRILTSLGLTVLLATIAAPVAQLEARQVWTSPGRGPVRPVPRGDVRGYNRIAATNGYEDGYREGLNDGRRNHRNDPFAESRFRNADHGYDRRFGPKELYRIDYRESFRSGYERGYRDGRFRDGRWR